MMTTDTTPTDTNIIKNYILAGKAIFTLNSPKLEKRYTYKIKVDTKNKNRFFVHLFFGNENDRDNNYRFLAWFYTDKTPVQIKTSQKSCETQTSLPIKMLSHFFVLLEETKNLPQQCEFYPSGRCGRCGHLLTTPESIKRGLGPECAEYAYSY